METLKITVNKKQISIVPSLGLYEVHDFMGKPLPGIAISLKSDGCPYATLTVSFGEFIGVKDCAYIDTNNCPWAVELLRNYPDVFKETSFKKTSGFCEYPLWHISPDWMRKVDENVYGQYSKACDEYYEEFMNGFDEDIDEDIDTL